MGLYSHITSRCFINVPFDRLRQDINFILQNKIQPEIGLEGDILYRYSLKNFEEVALILKKEGLSCTLHAPFFDLAPGALDEHILKISREKLKKAFELIPVFKPSSIVCHLNYEENKHGYKKEEWFKYALETWQQLLPIAEKHQTPMMLENTYETNPEQHKSILENLASPYAGFCLDVGHVQSFAKNRWQDWLPAMEPWLGQLHLHDNFGDYDNHLAIGKGTFDFSGLFNYVKIKQLKPIITLEPHTEEDLWGSLTALDQMAFFDTQV